VDSLLYDQVAPHYQVFIDSNIALYHRSSSDIDKINAVNQIVKLCWDENVWPKYNLWVLDATRKSLKKKHDDTTIVQLRQSEAGALYYVAWDLSVKTDYDNCVRVYEECLAIYDDLKDTIGIANTLDNIGAVYKIQGNYMTAINYHTQSLVIREKVNHRIGISSSLSNIAALQKELGEYDKALANFERALQITKEENYQPGVSSALNNIGAIYLDLGEYDKAIEVQQQSLVIKQALGDKQGIASSLANIGLSLLKLGENEKALDRITKGLAIYREIGDKQGIAISQILLGNIASDKENYSLAYQYYKEALTNAQTIGALQQIMDASKALYYANKRLNKPARTLAMFELYISSRDSLDSESNQKEIIRQGFKYDYDKKHLGDSLAFEQQQEIESLAYQAELDKEANQRYVLYGGLVFLLLLGGVTFRGYQRKRKDNILITEQKKEVEHQKEIVEEAHQEIKDSIAYAKRIQSAILPPVKLVKEYLKESFILYKPKDVVAGDFYWMESVAEPVLSEAEVTGKNKITKVLYAAADCTGHGVPGAMVSVVCNNALNRSIREYGLTDPGEILTKTREIVIQEFEKSEEEVKDGMDIALCSLEGNKLQYAGANNPLWIIRDCHTEPVEVLDNPNMSVFRQAQDDTLCIIETKANKQPIGQFDNPEPYTTHSFELEQGDSIYIFSDGYVDQFGGEKGKKFKAKAFRELLLSIQDKSMEEQKTIIDDVFETWKGTLEQIDDVCIIGVRI
jgi:serine phosphatase RsbU (regulator of sigma subunit)